MFSAGLIYRSYLNVVDVVPVPGCAEKLVTESKDEDVLHHLLAKVMINSVELVFAPVWG